MSLVDTLSSADSADTEQDEWNKFTKKELKQIRLWASISNGTLEYFRDDLTRILAEWKEIIKRLNIDESSPCPAGGKYYYFEKPCYLTQFKTNLEALEYLVKKLNRLVPKKKTVVVLNDGVIEVYSVYEDVWNDLPESISGYEEAENTAAVIAEKGELVSKWSVDYIVDLRDY